MRTLLNLVELYSIKKEKGDLTAGFRGRVSKTPYRPKPLAYRSNVKPFAYRPIPLAFNRQTIILLRAWR